MKQFNRQLILFLFLALITSSMTFARKPAVEPVSGISIDQYDDVAPSKATPFDFTQNEKSKSLAPVRKSPVKETNVEMMDDSKSTTNKTIVILMICLLPIAVWLGLMKGVKDLEEEVPSNVVDLDSKRESDNDDDMNFPKAS
ncbi:hypothetical protein [Halobacteriovorax sp. JY17]|uniref:hypothetical protein n=1 Tax=Halobacteriovorax sp. JY17 TaxID=2014617 RepID=UPI000C619B0B|nr:hypothetical protein [Halobacteriovorax sp. JY17]PIK14979.1 MAG: hypothetical protein CES88_11640 [Halobacteriovorax sp. JY17]